MLEEQIFQIAQMQQEIGADLYVKAFKNAGIAALTIGQFRYLEMISKNPGITASKLAKTFEVKMPTVTNTIKELAKRGLIRKNKSDDDRRVYNLSVTKEALDIFEYRNKMYRIFADRIRGILSKDKLKQLNELFGEIIERM